MAVQNSKMFSVLFVILISVLFLIFSSEHLSKSISWKNKHRSAGRLLESDIIFWEKKGNLTPPPAALSTTYAAKMTEQKTHPIKTFRSSRDGEAETPIPPLYKKSFKMFPQWDFEEVYNQDATPRQTTCAQSLRNSEDESFQKAFLPNMRLYLHKGTINMSEWNRLSHFNNPFGFMEYKYDDVMASVAQIPKPNEPLLLPQPGSGGCVHCAVVGTAGILNGSKMGKEIDSHDYVFRMNGAVINGYEEDVGNKTSVYVHTAFSITSSQFGLRKYGYTSVPKDEGIKFVLIPEGMRDFEWLQGLLKGERVAAGSFKNERPRRFYAGQYNESRFYVLHQDFLRYVRNRFLKSPNLNSSYWPIVRPTNGAFTLFLALHTCDTKKGVIRHMGYTLENIQHSCEDGCHSHTHLVDAYGFMTEDYTKYSNYYFERGVKTRVIFYANHDYILEMKTWKKLHNSKIIKLYQRTDSETETEKSH